MTENWKWDIGTECHCGRKLRKRDGKLIADKLLTFIDGKWVGASGHLCEQHSNQIVASMGAFPWNDTDIGLMLLKFDLLEMIADYQFGDWRIPYEVNGGDPVIIEKHRKALRAGPLAAELRRWRSHGVRFQTEEDYKTFDFSSIPFVRDEQTRPVGV
tara:strand:+ start:89 stop:559 length:471 start_codon:yes stop_codon:yes gene_type:complete